MSTPGSARRPGKAGLALRGFGALAFVVLLVMASRSPTVSEFLTQERLVALLEELRAAWWSPFALIGLFVVVSVSGLPASPIVFSGAAVFGFGFGVFLNTAGLFTGAAVSFGLGHLLGRDLVIHFTGPKLRRAEKIFARRGFWPLIQLRFLPIPFALQNYGCALGGVPVGRYLLSSLIGLLPSTTIHTYFLAKMVRVEDKEELLPILVVYLGILVAFNIVLSWPTIRERRRRKARYAELLERRRQRSEQE